MYFQGRVRIGWRSGGANFRQLIMHRFERRRLTFRTERHLVRADIETFCTGDRTKAGEESEVSAIGMQGGEQGCIFMAVVRDINGLAYFSNWEMFSSNVVH